MQKWHYLEWVSSRAWIFVSEEMKPSMVEFLRRSLANKGKVETLRDGMIEYKGVTSRDMFDVLGADGWELVAQHDENYVFKRPY